MRHTTRRRTNGIPLQQRLRNNSPWTVVTRLSDVNYLIKDESTTKSKVVHFNRLKACNVVLSTNELEEVALSESDEEFVKVQMMQQAQQPQQQMPSQPKYLKSPVVHYYNNNNTLQNQNSTTTMTVPQPQIKVVMQLIKNCINNKK